MKRFILATTMVAALFPLTPGVASSQEPPIEAHATGTYTFTGGGWGHSVGMSQYGAWGMADAGYDYAGIVDYYYTDVTIGQLADSYAADHLLGSDDPQIWVGLLEDEGDFTFEIPADATGGVDLCQAGDGTGDCPKPDATPQPGETWKFESVVGPEGAEQCQFIRLEPDPLVTPAAAGDCTGSITFGKPGLAAIIEVAGVDYAHGTVRIRQGTAQVGTWTFHVALEIGLEDYLLGLGEMPSSWPSDALKAQALAGRSYAAYRVATYYNASAADPITAARKDSCYCHLRSTPVDQNYVGYSKESEPTYGALWTAAVQATAGETIKSGGLPIQAFYGSSTGGATENSEDVFVSALSYARSVDDPFSVGSHNPLASWTKSFTTDDLESRLGFSEIDQVTMVNPAPKATLRVTGVKNGADVTEDIAIGPIYSSAFGFNSPSIHEVEYVLDPGQDLFDDIADSVHRYNINEIAERAISLGCNPPDNNLFCPKSDVTRGQMAAFINRALNLPATEHDFFTDDESSIFENDINELAAAGVGLGCTETEFCPSQPITREEMAAFLVRSMGLTHTGTKAFVDIGGSPYQDEILVLGNAGITLGCNPPDNDEFCPTDHVTRAQMATFLMRSIDELEGR